MAPVSGSQLTPYFSPKRREAAREGPVFGDEAFQLRFINTLEQLFKGGGLEVRQDDQHPLAGAQADIGLGKGALVPGKQHPAVFHPDVGDIQPPQLVAGNALKPEQAGDGKFVS